MKLGLTFVCKYYDINTCNISKRLKKYSNLKLKGYPYAYIPVVPYLWTIPWPIVHILLVLSMVVVVLSVRRNSIMFLEQGGWGLVYNLTI